MILIKHKNIMTQAEIIKIIIENGFELEGKQGNKTYEFGIGDIYRISRLLLNKLTVIQSSLQLRDKSKSFLNIKTIADLIKLYPDQSSYGVKCDKEYIHFSVNNKVVLTKALIV